MSNIQRNNTRLSVRIATKFAAIVAFAKIGLTTFGASAAHADILVGGVQFQNSTAACGSWLSVWVGDNMTYSPGRYAQVVLYDYTARTWVYGPWHQLNGYGMQLENDFSFGHHGYYQPVVHYAVLTAAGWQHGWYYFSTYTQRTTYGSTYLSSTCYI